MPKSATCLNLVWTSSKYGSNFVNRWFELSPNLVEPCSTLGPNLVQADADSDADTRAEAGAYAHPDADDCWGHRATLEDFRRLWMTLGDFGHAWSTLFKKHINEAVESTMSFI